jgi:MFS family permease
MYRHNLVFAAACMGMLMFGMVFLSLGTISVFIQEKHQFDALHVASLASSLPFGMLLGSLVFGPVVDRFGFKSLLVTCTGLIILAFELISFAESVHMMQVSYFLIGFGGGAINGGTNALVADITSGSKGAKLSLLGVFFGFGALGMPILIGSLTGKRDYETILSGIGFFLLLPVIYFLIIKFPVPKQKQGFPVGKALVLLKEPLLIMLGFVLFFESALEGIVGNWSTTFLKSQKIMDQEALYALSYMVAAMAVARLVLSRALKIFSSRFVLRLSFILIFAGTVVTMFVDSFYMAILAMVLLGFGFAAVFPVVLGYVGAAYPDLSGTAFSMVIVLALTGNILVNYLTGLVADSAGIQKFPGILIICIIFMASIYQLTLKKFPIKPKA